MLRISVKTHALGLLATLLVLPALPAQAATESDPWEGFNRSVFAFNETLDEYVLLPVTRAYRAVTPDPLEKGVHNFFSNLGDVSSLVNNLFQLKFHDAAKDSARLVANSSFGLFGLIDVATPLGLPRQGEDFGQTLGYWGVGTGPYLVLPVLGPSNVRDGVARIPDQRLDPVDYVEDDTSRWGLIILRGIDQRSQLIRSERLISGDRYVFIRDAYLQRREFQVRDGEMTDVYEDDGF